MPRPRTAADPRGGTKQAIAFGLVNVPVKVKSLKDTKARKAIASNYICPDHKQKLATRRYCETGDHYPEAIRAWPVNGSYVTLDEDLLDEIVAQKTGELRVDAFVPLEQIDPIYYNSSYLLYPAEGGATQYDLIAAALRETNRAAVGHSVFAGAKSSTLIVVRWSPATETLVAHSCLYEESIAWGDVELVANAAQARPAPAAQGVGLAKQVIQSLEGDFDPAAAEDTYAAALRELIEQAAQGATPKPQPKPAAQPTAAEDLIAALRESVAAAKATPKPKKKVAAR